MRKGHGSLLVAAVVCALPLAQCESNSGTCTPHEMTYCMAGSLYWMNSCGSLEELLQTCPLGCNALETGCQDGGACTTAADCSLGQVCHASACCTPACQDRCCGDDACGGACPDTCAGGQVCGGSCTCQTVCDPHAARVCAAGVLFWQDSCGNREEDIESCLLGCNPAGTACLEQTGCSSSDQCSTGQVCFDGSCCAPACEGRCCDDDGCGGTCPDTCAASGLVCNLLCLCEAGCQAETCGTLGRECGAADDGCGQTLQCGACDADETCDANGRCQATLARFSFFVTSLRALRDLSDSQDGFGGNLTYGHTGDRAGLDGADALCAAIAERSMTGASTKRWRAFLCTSYEDAIDRVGEGPWYDRRGRVLAPSKADLLNSRPLNGSAIIRNDFPNEDGVLNHDPDLTGDVDNHDMLTGCDEDGRLYSGSAACLDWTSAGSQVGRPRVGHSWPRTGGREPGDQDPAHWISAMEANGCAPGVNLTESMGNEPTVGASGGYGGFYCFSLDP
ncbi:MAG TPA: hypothetical protein PK668_23425 [Myxococcota bacterium]|nr:hypothetical protein [Myxococcota bacterium]HRY96499.1 hypothetical protein [Myxococcota bacterium]HSA21960.1 hypothetical protein [Myxococcota bacterium]